MYFNVSSAEYLNDYRIKISFKNGKTGIVDLAEYISEGEIYTEIRSHNDFKNFNVEFGTLVWKDGEIDIAPETLYEKATGEKIILLQGPAEQAV